MGLMPAADWKVRTASQQMLLWQVGAGGGECGTLTLNPTCSTWAGPAPASS